MSIKMLYLHATIITINDSRDVFLDGGILVRENKIDDIGTAKQLSEKYPTEELVDLSGRIMIPGLISTHMHTAQTLLRGKSHLEHHIMFNRRRDILTDLGNSVKQVPRMIWSSSLGCVKESGCSKVTSQSKMDTPLQEAALQRCC